MFSHANPYEFALNALMKAIEEETKSATTLEEIQLIRRIIARAKELNFKEAA